MALDMASMEESKELETLRARIADLEQAEAQRKLAEEAIQKAKVELEQRVKERTAELRAANEQLSLEIDQHKQTAEAERRERVLAEMLADTSKILGRAVDIEGTLKLILADQLEPIIQHDWAMVLLVEGANLRVVAARGFPNQDQILGNTYYYPDISLFYEPMLACKPLLVEDLQNDQGLDQMPDGMESARGWVGVPLTAWDVVTGFFCIGSARPNTYNSRDLKTITAFAQQIALAIENAHIITELETSLSELRKTQAHLARSARLSAAGEIAAGVAHQINNPLTAIIAQAHILMEDIMPGRPGYDSALVIKEAAYRAGAVVQRLLDFARTHPYDMQPLDINLSLQSALSLIRAQIEPHIARLHIDLAPDLPSIKASKEHLEEVWTNLLLNARDATSQLEHSVIKIQSAFDSEANAITVSIQDNGEGISAENLVRVFDPFFTTKKHGQGTGLGLAVCHDIITDHDGSIRVESDGVSGQGTTFTITLPLNANTL
jgi:C4-dicarboxylate-specific signal transduction histidine kinase